jgi:exopolyphosphatase/guanosine-5'-triphosphate,3'-diphosphate pyrophosphatase
MYNIGIIDIGSNSIRLILVQIGENKNFKIINDLKESVRLEEGMMPNQEISEAKIEKAIDVLAMFKSMCESINTTEIITIGTEAIRNSSNRDQIIQKVFEATGLKIKILSGEEEAYYSFLGVAKSMQQSENSLIMDMGGGSTELIWNQSGQLIHSISLPFGAINLTHRFKIQDVINHNQITSLQNYMREMLDQVPWLKKIKAKNLVGIGGSVRNIGKIDRRNKNYPLDITHNYVMNTGDVKNILSDLSSVDLQGRKEVKGLAKDRADIIVGATAALYCLLDYCNIDKMTISGSGLREGFIFSYLGYDVANICPLEFSIYNSLNNYNLNISHAEQVYRLSLALFNQLQPLHGLDEKLVKVLKTASFMHHSGLNIRYYNYHEHSFYMVMHCGLLGLTHRELLLSAYVAAAHNKDNYKLDLRTYAHLLKRDDVLPVHKLGLFVKIAESLDRSLSNNILDIKCSIINNTVVIKTISNSYNALEINEAQKAAAYFRKLFKKKLLVV